MASQEDRLNQAEGLFKKITQEVSSWRRSVPDQKKQEAKVKAQKFCGLLVEIYKALPEEQRDQGRSCTWLSKLEQQYPQFQITVDAGTSGTYPGRMKHYLDLMIIYDGGERPLWDVGGEALKFLKMQL